MNNKTVIPLMLSVVSSVLFISPEILGIFVKTGISMSQNRSIILAAIVLGIAGTGLFYGFYLFGKKFFLLKKALIIIGMLSCLAIMIVATGMILFILNTAA